MKPPLLLLLTVGLLANTGRGQLIEVPLSTDPLAPETREAHDARMAWWRQARFGMFIHFGLYSTAAGEWNGEKTRGAGEWIMNDLKIPANEYGRLANQFNPTQFDADSWAKLAKDAGMQYVIITSKHHDGFCLFDSRLTDFDVMFTPFKRDIMKELSTAVRASGMKMGWYYSIMDWHDPDAQTAETFGQYEWRMRAQVAELLKNYGEIAVMWFDGEWTPPWNDERGKNLYQLCRTVQPNVIVNNRVGKHRAGMGGFTQAGGFAGDYATPEQEIPASVPAGLDWETCMTMNDTWGYKSSDDRWKSTTKLIRQLVDVASKGGNFLLNVGPMGNGEIPHTSIERLAEIGKWMKVNGDAIYGTTASPFATRLPFRCTQKAGKLYLFVADWPADHLLTVPVANSATKAYLLAQPDPPLDFDKTAAGIVVKIPVQMPDEDATVIALEIQGPSQLIAAAPTTAPATRPATTSTTQSR